MSSIKQPKSSTPMLFTSTLSLFKEQFASEMARRPTDQERAQWNKSHRNMTCSECKKLKLGVKCVVQANNNACSICVLRKVECSRTVAEREDRVKRTLHIDNRTFRMLRASIDNEIGIRKEAEDEVEFFQSASKSISSSKIENPDNHSTTNPSTGAVENGAASTSDETARNGESDIIAVTPFKFSKVSDHNPGRSSNFRASFGSTATANSRLSKPATFPHSRSLPTTASRATPAPGNTPTTSKTRFSKYEEHVPKPPVRSTAVPLIAVASQLKPTIRAQLSTKSITSAAVHRPPTVTPAPFAKPKKRKRNGDLHKHWGKKLLSFKDSVVQVPSVARFLDEPLQAQTSKRVKSLGGNDAVARGEELVSEPFFELQDAFMTVSSAPDSTQEDVSTFSPPSITSSTSTSAATGIISATDMIPAFIPDIAAASKPDSSGMQLVPQSNVETCPTSITSDGEQGRIPHIVTHTSVENNTNESRSNVIAINDAPNGTELNDANLDKADPAPLPSLASVDPTFTSSTDSSQANALPDSLDGCEIETGPTLSLVPYLDSMPSSRASSPDPVPVPSVAAEVEGAVAPSLAKANVPTNSPIADAEIITGAESTSSASHDSGPTSFDFTSAPSDADVLSLLASLTSLAASLRADTSATNSAIVSVSNPGPSSDESPSTIIPSESFSNSHPGVSLRADISATNDASASVPDSFHSGPSSGTSSSTIIPSGTHSNSPPNFSPLNCLAAAATAVIETKALAKSNPTPAPDSEVALVAETETHMVNVIDSTDSAGTTGKDSFQDAMRGAQALGSESDVNDDHTQIAAQTDINTDTDSSSNGKRKRDSEVGPGGEDDSSQSKEVRQDSKAVESSGDSEENRKNTNENREERQRKRLRRDKDSDDGQVEQGNDSRREDGDDECSRAKQSLDVDISDSEPVAEPSTAESQQPTSTPAPTLAQTSTTFSETSASIPIPDSASVAVSSPARAPVLPVVPVSETSSVLAPAAAPSSASPIEAIDKASAASRQRAVPVSLSPASSVIAPASAPSSASPTKIVNEANRTSQQITIPVSATSSVSVLTSAPSATSLIEPNRKPQERKPAPQFHVSQFRPFQLRDVHSWNASESNHSSHLDSSTRSDSDETSSPAPENLLGSPPQSYQEQEKRPQALHTQQEHQLMHAHSQSQPQKRPEARVGTPLQPIPPAQPDENNESSHESQQMSYPRIPFQTITRAQMPTLEKGAHASTKNQMDQTNGSKYCNPFSSKQDKHPSNTLEIDKMQLALLYAETQHLTVQLANEEEKLAFTQKELDTTVVERTRREEDGDLAESDSSSSASYSPTSAYFADIAEHTHLRLLHRLLRQTIEDFRVGKMSEVHLVESCDNLSAHLRESAERIIGVVAEDTGYDAIRGELRRKVDSNGRDGGLKGKGKRRRED